MPLDLSRRAVLASLALGSLAACSREGEQTSSRGMPVIRHNTGGMPGEIGMLLAHDRRYYEQEGIRVEFIPTLSLNSTDALALLATGEVDITAFGPSAGMFNALASGMPVVGLAAYTTARDGDSSTGIVVRSDLVDSGRYKSPEDLKGMRCAVTVRGSSGHYKMYKALQLGGLTFADVELVYLSILDCITAFANKALDACFLTEPHITGAEAQGVGRLVIPTYKIGFGTPNVVAFTSTAYAQASRPMLEKFMTGFLRGQRDYLKAVESGEDKEAALVAFQRHAALKDMGVLRKLHLPRVDPNGGYDPAAIDDMQNFYLSEKLQEKRIDSTRLFDMSFVNAAVAKLGRV